MASNLMIFSIYKLQNEVCSDKYYLLRTGQPAYSNVSEPQRDHAVAIEQRKRKTLLDYIKKIYPTESNPEFIGEFQGLPIGDKLYSKFGKDDLIIYYMETDYGYPWIIVGNAHSEEEFLAELNADDDLLAMRPVGLPKRILAEFITENDFYLSEANDF